MKVKVISSRHSHISPGMIGEAEEWEETFLDSQIEVTFENVPSPVPGNHTSGTVTVMMLRSELQACK